MSVRLEDWSDEQIELVRVRLDELFGTVDGCYHKDDAVAVIEAVTTAHPAWFHPVVVFPPSELK